MIKIVAKAAVGFTLSVTVLVGRPATRRRAKAAFGRLRSVRDRLGPGFVVRYTVDDTVNGGRLGWVPLSKLWPALPVRPLATKISVAVLSLAAAACP
jgi:hypothetical protein